MSRRLVCSIDTSWMDGPPCERQGHCIFEGNELVEAKEYAPKIEQEKQMTKRHPAVKQMGRRMSESEIAAEAKELVEAQKPLVMRTFETGATRDTEEGKLDYDGFLSPLTLRRYAEYMHKHRKQSDGEMRDSDNWQKGIPLVAYMKSLWRHLVDLWTLHRNLGVALEREDALCAIIFNASGYLHELLKSRNAESVADKNWLGLTGHQDRTIQETKKEARENASSVIPTDIPRLGPKV